MTTMADHKDTDTMKLEEVIPTGDDSLKAENAITAYRSMPADELAVAEKKLVRKLDMVSLYLRPIIVVSSGLIRRRGSCQR